MKFHTPEKTKDLGLKQPLAGLGFSTVEFTAKEIAELSKLPAEQLHLFIAHLSTRALGTHL